MRANGQDDLVFQTGHRRVTIDGKVWQMHLGMEALATLQETWKLKDVDALNARFNNLGIRDFKDVFYAGMIEHQPDTTRAAAHKLFNSLDMTAGMKLITALVQGIKPPANSTLPSRPPGPARRANR